MHNSQCTCPLCELKVGPDFEKDNTNPELAKQIKLAVQKGGKPGDVPKFEPRGTQFVHDEYHVICQATFKEHCQFPKCDCDRNPEHPNTCRCEVCRFWS